MRRTIFTPSGQEQDVEWPDAFVVYIPDSTSSDLASVIAADIKEEVIHAVAEGRPPVFILNPSHGVHVQPVHAPIRAMDDED